MRIRNKTLTQFNKSCGAIKQKRQTFALGGADTTPPISKNLRTLLAIMLLIATNVTVHAYDFEYNGLYYNITSYPNSSTRTCEVTFGPSGSISNYGSFQGTSDYTMPDVVIPEGVAYAGSRYLVTSIGKYAFYKCTAIESLSIGSNVTTINQNAFGYCSNLKSVNLGDGVTKLLDNAFIECRTITTFVMPSVEYIGKQALAYTTSISNLSIPKCTKVIAGEGLACMQSLRSIVVDIENPYFASEEGVLYNKEKTKLKHFPENSPLNEFFVPEGVEELDTLCFFWSKLKKITLPETVKTIRCRAFGSCTELEEIDLGNSVENMGEYATFWYCPKLKKIRIPNKVKSLGSYCFRYVPLLEEVIIGENVTSLSSYCIDLSASNDGVPSNSVLDGNLILLCKEKPSGLENLPVKPRVRHGLTDRWKSSSSGGYYTPDYFEYMYNSYLPTKGRWYEASGDYTGLYCSGDTLYVFGSTYQFSAPTDMSDYASESDFKYNPNAKFYNNNCLAFDLSQCDVNALDLVGRKISADAIIGKTVDDIDKCGINCYTIYTSVLPEHTRRGDEYNMNTYRVINFAAPEDDGNGYPYYLIMPKIGERCKVKGTYYSSRGGLYASGKNYSYTLKLWGVKNLINGRSYELEGIVRKINGEYVFDISDGITLNNSISKEPVFGDMSVELSSPDANASYQWKQIRPSKCIDVIEFTSNSSCKYKDGQWVSNTLSYSSTSLYMQSKDHYETGDTLYLDYKLYGVASMTITLGSETVSLSQNKYIVTKDQDAWLTIKLTGSSGYVVISKAEIRRATPKDVGFDIEGATSANLPDLLFPSESKVYCEVTLSHGQKLMSNIVENLRVDLIDALPYSNSDIKENRYVYYTREFNNDEWQALFLPYSMSYEEWKDFGEVAELSNVGLNAVNEPILIWQRITEGELLPNHPYIFKPYMTGEVVFYGENKTIMSTDNFDVVSFNAEGVIYSLTGTYQEKSDMATTHAYALSGGDFRPTNSNTKTLKPFRIYLTINNGSQKAPQRVCNIIADDNDLSGIQIITTNSLNQESTYYDLMGRKVDNPSKGIYIQNNKKVIIK